MRLRLTSVGLIGTSAPAGFVYPDHIDRDSIEALPPKPGIYRFLDANGQALYIGKSVHLRNRVRAHLRTPEEAAMLAQTRRIDHVRTAGEIGALLLELQRIRSEQPPYNCLLKEAGDAYLLRWEPSGMPDVVASSMADDRERPMLYGLFVSRWAAWEGLRALLKRHRLCPAAVGLEQTVRGRGCFAWQIGHCAGACLGKESRGVHDTRLKQALESLQSSIWPFGGPIGIREELDGWRQTHIIDRWCYLGTLEGRRRRLQGARAKLFDIDIYKILMRPLLLGELDVTPYPDGRPVRQACRQA